MNRHAIHSSFDALFSLTIRWFCFSLFILLTTAVDGFPASAICRGPMTWCHESRCDVSQPTICSPPGAVQGAGRQGSCVLHNTELWREAVSPCPASTQPPQPLSTSGLQLYDNAESSVECYLLRSKMFYTSCSRQNKRMNISPTDLSMLSKAKAYQ